MIHISPRACLSFEEARTLFHITRSREFLREITVAIWNWGFILHYIPVSSMEGYLFIFLLFSFWSSKVVFQRIINGKHFRDFLSLFFHLPRADWIWPLLWRSSVAWRKEKRFPLESRSTASISLKPPTSIIPRNLIYIFKLKGLCVASLSECFQRLSTIWAIGSCQI